MVFCEDYFISCSLHMHGHTHLCTHCGWCHHKATLICMFMIILSFIQLSKTLIFSVSPSYTHSCSHAHTHTFTYTHTLSLCLSLSVSLSLSLSLWLQWTCPLASPIPVVHVLWLLCQQIQQAPGLWEPGLLVAAGANFTSTCPKITEPSNSFIKSQNPLPLIFVVLVETTSSLNINLKRLYSSYLPLTHARSRARTHTLSSISSAKFQEF